ncbi:bifunctional 2-polyprenyl-6-hydroxyphenol methylase/3-demethylubiquinol 3-O-methyltransferase UbiG [Halobacillus sp. A5]|uniref:class I SAM-dependent methyltransferase n=1 Tax=Halobacillus sp. A5 TaxID=2880263 RepID=UPI0020A62BC2|nr:class I SAM-dependent methyltransferase [Halobacillus sp. A5]MCP3027729.1 class I SAM-dependent methyltransferase [Halobacillus sp. A5]
MLGYYSSLSSEVYDMDKPVGHSFGDVKFYIDRLSSVHGTILEPATGTGRILIPLLEEGMDVDGFDSSSDMLEICRENCEKRSLTPNLFHAQMESFSLETEYEAIIIPTGTFLLLHERDTSIQALKNFYKHLRNGGKLILDIFLQTEAPVGEVSTRSWECANGDVITLEDKKVDVDYVRQYTISHGRYERWRNGKLIETELERFPLRWYGIEEFKMILGDVGFQNIEISSNYNLGEYPTSPDQIVTFEAVKIKE